MMKISLSSEYRVIQTCSIHQLVFSSLIVDSSTYMSVIFAFLLLVLASGDTERFVLTDFHRVQDVYMLNSSTAIIVQQTSDFPVQIVDLKTQKVLHRLLKKGRGPGELENITGSAYNVSEKTLYVIGTARKLVELKLNDANQVTSIREKIVKTTFNPHNITIYGDQLYIGTSVRLNGKAISEFTQQIQCGIAVIKTSLETTTAYHFEMSNLNIQHVKDIQKVDYIQFNTRILPDDRYSYIIIERLPVILVYDRQNRFLNSIDIGKSTGLPGISATYRQDYGAWALSSPPVSEFAIRYDGAYYIGYGYFGRAPYKGTLRIASGDVTEYMQFDEPRSYPPVMRCSLGNGFVACYNGYMSFDDVVVVSHPESQFFKES